MSTPSFRIPSSRIGALLLAAASLMLSTHASAQGIDLALTELVSPATGCTLGVEPVTIRVFNNNGPELAAGTTILALYSVDGGSASNHSFTLIEALPTNTSRLLTFPVPADLSVPGPHTLMVSTQLANDTNTGNNTLHNVAVSHVAMSNGGLLQRNGDSLSLADHVGSVMQWEESPDGLRWFKLVNSDTTQTFAGIDAATRFRVRVVNAPCPAATSNVITVNP